MKKIEDMTLRDLVGGLSLALGAYDSARPTIDELSRRLPEIEAAVEGMEKVDTYDRNTGDTVYSIKCKLNAYRASRDARRGDANHD